MSIWEFNDVLAKRLRGWNIVNIIVGLLLLPRSAFWRGFGSQNIGWGIVNMTIAVGGTRLTQRRFAVLADPYQHQIQIKEARNLSRLLWINTFLDIFYMAGGGWLAVTRGKTSPRWRGTGYGIMLQGMLLFLFDLFHALAVPPQTR